MFFLPRRWDLTVWSLPCPRRNKFERGKEDVFSIKALHLGEITKVRPEATRPSHLHATGWAQQSHLQLRIGHDNKGMGAAWHLDRVVVKDPSTGVVSLHGPCHTRRLAYSPPYPGFGNIGKAIVFPCNRWFAMNEDDGQIERELVPATAEHAAASTTTYIVRVKTGDERYAGTDANVCREPAACVICAALTPPPAFAVARCT